VNIQNCQPHYGYFLEEITLVGLTILDIHLTSEFYELAALTVSISLVVLVVLLLCYFQCSILCALLRTHSCISLYYFVFEIGGEGVVVKTMT
jgi:hypothetical protein